MQEETGSTSSVYVFALSANGMVEESLSAALAAYHAVDATKQHMIVEWVKAALLTEEPTSDRIKAGAEKERTMFFMEKQHAVDKKRWLPVNISSTGDGKYTMSSYDGRLLENKSTSGARSTLMEVAELLEALAVEYLVPARLRLYTDMLRVLKIRCTFMLHGLLNNYTSHSPPSPLYVVVPLRANSTCVARL